MSDVEIKDHVKNHLFWDSRVDASDVQVEVKNGHVTLKGTVPSYRGKIAAEDIAMIKGVTVIDNMLDVRFAQEDVPKNEELKTVVEAVLRSSPDIDANKLAVTVQGSEVALTGTTESFWQRRTAEEIVFNVLGVTKLTSTISIEPATPPQDKSIEQDVKSALERNSHIDSSEVNVKVEEGVVTLSGKVEDWLARREAIDAACLTAGVRGVQDRMSVTAD
jgi:hyperosmotically inducible protein